MIAGLTILTVLGFVFLPMCIERGTTRATQDPVVVKTTKYGNLRLTDLHQLMEQRRRAAAIMLRLAEAAERNGADYRLAKSLADQWTQTSEESAVQKWLLQQFAREHNVVISDESVKDFLKQVTQDRVSASEIQQAFRKLELSDFSAFNLLRGELLVERAFQVFAPNIMGTTPAQRWDFFKRLKQQATVELVPIDVGKFMDKVKEPSQQDLNRFFNEHKDVVANPALPEIGFREPAKIDIRYFKVNFDKFTTDNVSDRQVLEEYENNKDFYDKQDKDRAGLTPPSAPAEKDKAEKDKSDKTPKEPGKDEKTSDEKPAAEQSTTENKAAETAPTETKPAETTPTESKPAETAPSETKPAEATPSEAKPADQSSAVRTDSPFRLASTMQEGATDEKPAADASAAKPEMKEDATAPAVTEEKPAVTEEKKGEETKDAVAEDKPAEKPAAEETPAKGPSERIKNVIRYKLASEKLQVVFNGLSDIITRYRDDEARFTESKDSNPDAKPPVEPDYKDLADKEQCIYADTGLVSVWQFSESDVARTFVGKDILSLGRAPLAQIAFSNSVPKDRPMTAIGLTGDRYLFWKIKETKEDTPKFEDVRDQVLKAWKLVEARKLAMAAAEKLAAEAKDSKKPLRETFAGREGIVVIDPPPFSWMSYGAMTPYTSRTPPRISEVEGAKMAGREFMRTVFDLTPSGVGVTMNQPETVAYVVRLVTFVPSDAVLWANFETTSYDSYAPAAVQDLNEVFRGWYTSIEKAAGLKKERTLKSGVND